MMTVGKNAMSFRGESAKAFFSAAIPIENSGQLW